MLHEIIWFFLLLLMEQAARQGRAVPFPATVNKSCVLDGVCYFKPHLIEETPSALWLRREAEAYVIYTENHIYNQCDVVPVIGFLEANYNAKISKSQEPSALFYYSYQMSIHALEAGLFFKCIYRQLMSVMRLVYRDTLQSICRHKKERCRAFKLSCVFRNWLLISQL